MTTQSTSSPRPRLMFGCAGLLFVLPALVALTRHAVAQTQPKYQGGCASAGCHAGLVEGPVVHAPAQNDGCSACHEEQSAAEHKFRFVAEGGKMCIECHDETLKGLAFAHGPAVDQCTACHAPHASKFPKLLTMEKKDLCVECHEDVKDRMADRKIVHQPASDDCTACHRPHGADNRMMLSALAPKLCLDCHDDVGEQFNDAKFKHEPVMQDGGCSRCHDAHASQAKSLLAAQPSMTLCLTCHDKEIKTAHRTLRDIAGRLKANPEHHGPVRDGDCTACHKGHGGPHPAILAEPFPERFYSPFSADAYKLCFECHEAEAFENAETDDATAFRNGRQNLHYLHVNKPSKGRSCAACHDPHASPFPHHVTDQATFGSWRIPIQYQATETGGSCATGCHRPYRYDREAPITNIPSTD